MNQVQNTDQRKPLVIFDLDGTLALIDQRRPILADASLSKDERWRKFFAACVDDTPNKAVIAIAFALYMAGYEVRIFSGRSYEVVEQTKDWLLRQGLNFISSLTMRTAADYTPDEVLKAIWYEALPQVDKDRLVCIFDDRDKVVAMWREKGIACFQVAPGNF